MVFANFNLIAGIVVFAAVFFFVYLLKSIDKKSNGPTFISESEKIKRIQNSVRSMLSSSELTDINHAQMLIEGMCKDDPVWMLQVLGDFRYNTPKWMESVPHRDHILRWARSKLNKS